MIIKCSASVAVYLSIVFSKKKVFKYGRRSAKSKRKKGSFEKKAVMPHVSDHATLRKMAN